MAGLGHLGFGFAAKRLAPKIPLGFLLGACMELDLLYIGLSLLGIESVNGVATFTHSMIMAVGWSLLTAGVTALIVRRFREALVMGLLVFSHWVLDAVVWPMTAVSPDMTQSQPLFLQAQPSIGLGLYRTVFGVILGEGVFLAAGIAVYIVTLVQIKRRKRAGLNEMAQGIE